MLNRKVLTSCTWLGRSHFRRLCSTAPKIEIKREFDLDYLTNYENRKKLKNNIIKRKEPCYLDRIIELRKQLKSETDPTEKKKLSELLSAEVRKMPNSTHAAVQSYEPKIIKSVKSTDLGYRLWDFDYLARHLGLVRVAELSALTGTRSYYLLGDLAELEHALVKYSISQLLRRNFTLVSVPDILPSEVIDGCGMNTSGERSQVYKLEEYDGSSLCLSGTAEMGLACLSANTIMDADELPILLAAVSRCYRKEVSSTKEAMSLYRLHCFTKVEMFGICHPSKSEQLFKSFIVIQDDIFSSLGLEYRIVDMPMCDLGMSAFRKFDIQVWYPGSKILGEISSCSNCTDYQAHWLNMRFKDGEKLRLVHTVNGTACAIPRTIMAIIESYQLPNGNIKIPQPLREYFNGREQIEKVV